MTVLFLIVARGGSKRVPRKNLQQIEELSLTAYKCIAALQSVCCDQAIISTDDPAIAQEAERYGVHAPFCRPDHLASDTATTEAVVKHAMSEVSACDAIMLLEPSSPFVSPKNYDAAVEFMVKEEAEFVFGQVLYLFRWDWLQERSDLYEDLTSGTRYFSMPTEEAIDIDTIADLALARWLAKERIVDLSWAER